MVTDRSILTSIALAAAIVLAIGADAQALIVCRTPDGATYATDNPPPDCAPIPSEPVAPMEPLSPSEPGAAEAQGYGEAPSYSEESSRDGYLPPESVPDTAYQQAPATGYGQSGYERYRPPVSEESRRAAAEESPESDRTHAIASCEQVVAEQLERPSTARWPNRSDYKYQARGSTIDRTSS